MLLHKWLHKDRAICYRYFFLPAAPAEPLFATVTEASTMNAQSFNAWSEVFRSSRCGPGGDGSNLGGGLGPVPAAGGICAGPVMSGDMTKMSEGRDSRISRMDVRIVLS